MRFLKYPKADTPTAWLYGRHGNEEQDVVRAVVQFAESQYSDIRKAWGILTPLVTESRRAYMHVAAAEMVELTEVAELEIHKGHMKRMGHRSQQDLPHRFMLTLLAFCSLQAFEQDDSLNQVKKSFGADSEEWKRARRIYDRLFDENLGYRLLAKLRNILHHDTMEVLKVSNSSWMEGEERKNRLEYRLSRAVLAKSRHINNRIQKEIENLQDDPLAEELAYQSLQGLTVASYELKPLMEPRYQWARSRIKELESHFEDCVGYRMLSDTCPEEPKSEAVSFHFPPFAIVTPEIIEESIGLLPIPTRPKIDSIPNFDWQRFHNEIREIDGHP